MEVYSNKRVQKGVIYPRISFSIQSIHFYPVRHHSHSASATLCKGKVMAYLLLNDSVMVYYIINHLSVTPTQVSYMFKQKIGLKSLRINPTLN